MVALTEDYLTTVQQSIAHIDTSRLDRVIGRLFDAYRHGQSVFTMGNGASAALASHMACDLGKGTATDLGRGPLSGSERRLRIVSLVDNVALLTAYGNDIDYADIFLEQLKNTMRAGDVVLGISGSGGSPNVLRAMEYARAYGATTIGLTGFQAKSRLLCDLCDISVQAPLTMMEQIEDLHVMFSHIISVGLRARIASDTAERLNVRSLEINGSAAVAAGS